MKTKIVNQLSKEASDKLHRLVAKWNIKYADKIAENRKKTNDS